MTLPNFLIIGGMKCGTTSLHHYLAQHPEIQTPSLKEANFFSGPPEGIPYPMGANRIVELQDYEALFDPAFRVRGEASPCYTLYPRRKGVPERISELLPDVKLIYILRDPVERLVSHYRFRVSLENETRSLVDALGDFSDQTSLYTCPGFYAAQLERYIAHFPQDNILIIQQEDLLAERIATLATVFRFLDVNDGYVSPQFREEVNTGRERRTYSKFVPLIERARMSRLHQLPRSVRRPLRNALERITSQPLDKPVLDQDLRARIQDLYAADASRLRQITGKAFEGWTV
jgi:hypothetical protein